MAERQRISSPARKTMLRATFVHYNTREEVLSLLKALNEIASKKKK